MHPTTQVVLSWAEFGCIFLFLMKNHLGPISFKKTNKNISMVGPFQLEGVLTCHGSFFEPKQRVLVLYWHSPTCLEYLEITTQSGTKHERAPTKSYF